MEVGSKVSHEKNTGEKIGKALRSRGATAKVGNVNNLHHSL